MTNPEKLMDTFSKEFENAFLDILNTRHPKTAVLANTVYQELIKDQFHVHMNSTTIVNILLIFLPEIKIQIFFF